MASVASNSKLLSKFRGCMVGSLIGDCLGAPFELLNPTPPKEKVEKYFSNLLNGGSTRTFPYTDDTSMTVSVARSLIEHKKVEPKDLAKRFVDEYFREPDLNYGLHVVTVFYTLKQTNFEDIFLPGKMQFNGSGSYGNGAAMRIAPVALFDHDKTDEALLSDVYECSRVTHNHPHGYNGAFLQCLAIKAALNSDSTKEFDPLDFINKLEKKMETVEKKDDSPFCESLKKIKELYVQDPEARDIGKILGNGETAQDAVPTAIYSFIRGMKPFSDYKCSNPFARTIFFAIAAGGDTDTIAAIAGAIAGAYHGIEGIPKELQERCRFRDEVDKLANELYEVSQNVTS